MKTHLNKTIKTLALGVCSSIALSSLSTISNAQDILPSWNDTPRKQAIIDFVDTVTDDQSEYYVAPEERIAVFDNDGTLWAEKPFYFQAYFALNRIKEIYEKNPEKYVDWKDKEPFASALKGNMDAVVAEGKKDLIKLVLQSHSGMTPDQFANIVKDWLAKEKHPILKKAYDNMIYQPMVELLEYLRDNEFKTYIVSAGGIEFMRPWSQEKYGIPPEQVIGSSVKTKLEEVDGKPQLIRQAEINFIDDGPNKPVAINQYIARRPIMAFGNSDGDFEMLKWTKAGDGKRLAVYIHHTDAEREWAYDKDSVVGHFDKGLDYAKEQGLENGWVLTDMKNDWRVIFP